MENKILAIKGHPTRRNEVIEILEMLGGKNISNIKGNYTYLYYIGDNNFISLTDNYRNDFTIFTLEEFLEKYPYKVGDKVLLKHDNQRLCTIEEMGWNNKEGVVYSISFNEGHSCWYSTDELQPYKEEIKTEDRLEIYADHAIDNDSKTDIIINGERLIAPNGYTIGNATRNSNKLIVEYIKNKPQYPKTFQECYSLKYNGQINLNIGCDILHGAYSEQLECLQNLLICRDIYWEIAGDWEEKRKKEINHYVIYSTLNGGLVKDCLSCTMVKHLLDFPTEEMRDAFYENFKDLIESCKEFL